MSILHRLPAGPQHAVRIERERRVNSASAMIRDITVASEGGFPTVTTPLWRTHWAA